MRMIPALERLGRLDSGPEQTVARLLAQAEAGGPVACLYSVHMPEHEYKRMTEIDFLVVWDDMILVVEVKGGRIDRREGIWRYTNRHGDWDENPRGPFHQAKTAMFALQGRLEERIPHLDLTFGYLVLTPNQELAEDVEWARAQYAGPTDMTVTGIERALANARQYWLAKRRHPARGGVYGELLTILRPDFDQVPSLGGQMIGLESTYVRLADRQYDVLAALETNPRLLCRGGAGSGKTLLAVEAARRATTDGSSVLLTCRSRPLARVLNRVLAGSTVVCRSISETAEIGPFDVLVVDEAQDLMDDTTVLGLDALLTGGLAHGRWRIFCDDNNQAHVDGRFDPRTLDELAASAVTFTLSFNCRNTVPIVQQTQLLTGADLGVARAGEGPAVHYELCPDPDSTARLLDAHLKGLRREGAEPGGIVVVTLADTIDTSAATLTRAFRTGRLVDAGGEEPPLDAVRLVTAAQFKGLEAQHVCVVDVQDIFGPLSRARLYVAMTRPRITLWIGLSDRAWQQFADPSFAEGDT